jgi:hypothetical protein
MRRQFLRTLVELRPMIKTCWEVLLRAEPPVSPLGNPDTLVFMMDRTLDTFFTAIHSPTPRRWLARHSMLCCPLAETCPCGRPPLLRYFVSGEQALVAITAKAIEETSTETAEKERILSVAQLTFHYLAQHELQIFCDLCRGRCARARIGLVTGQRHGPPRSRRQPRVPRRRLQDLAARTL